MPRSDASKFIALSPYRPPSVWFNICNGMFLEDMCWPVRVLTPPT